MSESIFPEDVEIETQTMVVYRGVGSNPWYNTEKAAREAAANTRHCERCNAATSYWNRLCDACNASDEHTAHLKKFQSAPYWDGKYPVFIDDTFIADEDAFIEWLVDSNADAACIDTLYASSPVYPRYLINADYLKECFEQNCEDAECTDEMIHCIDRFIADIAKINKPFYYERQKLVRMTQDQIDYLNTRAEDEK